MAKTVAEQCDLMKKGDMEKPSLNSMRIKSCLLNTYVHIHTIILHKLGVRTRDASSVHVFNNKLTARS